MANEFDIRALIDHPNYSNNSGDIGGRMRLGKQVHFGPEIDCNRPDLWESFERDGLKKSTKIFKRGGRIALFAGVVALGAAAVNKFSTEA